MTRYVVSTTGRDPLNAGVFDTPAEALAFVMGRIEAIGRIEDLATLNGQRARLRDQLTECVPVTFVAEVTNGLNFTIDPVS